MSNRKRANNVKTETANKLAVVLASSYTLQLKLQNFHWNVTGPHFGPLHELFGQQYNEIFAAIDLVAERIRALDVVAPGSFAAFGKLTKIEEAPADPPSYKEMIRALAEDHEAVSAICSETGAFADDNDDTATGDLMNERIAAHDKAAWMLRSHLA